MVVVSLSMPRRMNVYHFKKGTEICNYSYSNNILAVKLNRQVIFFKPSSCQRDLFIVSRATLTSSSPSQRLVVCLEESIYIHNIKDMKLLKTLLNTPTNPSGTLSSLLFSLIRPGLRRSRARRRLCQDVKQQSCRNALKCTYTQAADFSFLSCAIHN